MRNPLSGRRTPSTAARREGRDEARAHGRRRLPGSRLGRAARRRPDENEGLRRPTRCRSECSDDGGADFSYHAAALRHRRRLAVTPDSDLTDGQVVELTGSFDRDSVLGVGICASEALDVVDPLEWCDINLRVERRRGASVLHVTVVRSIDTSHGLVDCAERPQRCLVGVRTERGGDVASFIAFRTDLEPVPRPVVEVDRHTVGDGESIAVSGSGFRSGEELFVSQCRGLVADLESLADRDSERCGVARGRTLIPRADGSFDVTFILYAEILTYEGWARCEPCALLVGGHRQARTALRVGVAADGPPVRPVVRIVPPGPYEPGQRVTLDGSGFQAAQAVGIAWCAFNTDRPEQEIAGDPNYGNAPCVYPAEGVVRPDDAGRFTVLDFPMPDEPFYPGGFGDCRQPGTRCGLADHPSEGSPPTFVTLFELQD
jgi:hypothetical protein